MILLDFYIVWLLGGDRIEQKVGRMNVDYLVIVVGV